MLLQESLLGDREGCSLPNGIRTGPVTSDVVASFRDQPNKRAHSTNAGTVTTTHGLLRRIGPAGAFEQKVTVSTSRLRFRKVSHLTRTLKAQVSHGVFP